MSRGHRETARRMPRTLLAEDDVFPGAVARSAWPAAASMKPDPGCSASKEGPAGAQGQACRGEANQMDRPQARDRPRPRLPRPPFSPHANPLLHQPAPMVGLESNGFGFAIPRPLRPSAGDWDGGNEVERVTGGPAKRLDCARSTQEEVLSRGLDASASRPPSQDVEPQGAGGEPRASSKEGAPLFFKSSFQSFSPLGRSRLTPSLRVTKS